MAISRALREEKYALSVTNSTKLQNQYYFLHVMFPSFSYNMTH